MGAKIGGISRAELIERLQQLAESEPPENLAYGACCYKPCSAYLVFGIPCPDCKQKGLTLTLYYNDFDKKTSKKILANNSTHNSLQILSWRICGEMLLRNYYAQN